MFLREGTQRILCLRVLPSKTRIISQPLGGPGKVARLLEALFENIEENMFSFVADEWPSELGTCDKTDLRTF
ncbi:hypothetical protein L596_012481 [Steinernema carpocapsae]|uniref:Uncharacterized protein n=1 Tax=Steinernema carpocapsae TaxID=34508 RepID=A0A4U5NXT4_STECR|nr:hypothetical protein L596_012481 [Steinernema carpocapsae]